MNILFITATRIGDAVLSTGVIEDLATRYPGARFTIACGAPPAPLFETVPHLDRLIITPKMRLHAHWLSLWASVAAKHWDLVYDLRGSALAHFLVARKKIVGKHRDESLHRVEELAQLTGMAKPPAPHLWLSDADRISAKALMPEGELILAVGPTANWGGKQWPVQRFAELAARATATGGSLAGARIAVLGADIERPMAKPMLEALPLERCVDLIGQPLRVAAACIARASAYVGNDSGLMHIAAAVGTPTLGLFGPSSEIRYGPWGEHCASVRTVEGFKELVQSERFDHTSQSSLMGSLTVDAAVKALEKVCARVKYGGERETG